MATRPAQQHGSHRRLYRLVGRVKRGLGWLTADRHVEAVGEAEMEDQHPPPPSDVGRVEREVKRRYGEADD